MFGKARVSLLVGLVSLSPCGTLKADRSFVRQLRFAKFDGKLPE
jgi:hypothetical protein